MAAPRRIDVSAFKARCLRVLDEVQATGAEVVITERGRPVARLRPVGRARGSLRGAWKGRARISGDIVHVDWSSAFEAAR